MCAKGAYWVGLYGKNTMSTKRQKRRDDGIKKRVDGQMSSLGSRAGSKNRPKAKAALRRSVAHDFSHLVRSKSAEAASTERTFIATEQLLKRAAAIPAKYRAQYIDEIVEGLDHLVEHQLESVAKNPAVGRPLIELIHAGRPDKVQAICHDLIRKSVHTCARNKSFLLALAELAKNGYAGKVMTKIHILNQNSPEALVKNPALGTVLEALANNGKRTDIFDLLNQLSRSHRYTAAQNSSIVRAAKAVNGPGIDPDKLTALTRRLIVPQLPPPIRPHGDSRQR